MWSSHTREYLAIQRQSTDTGYNTEELLWRKTQDHVLQDPITIKCPEEANQERQRYISGCLALEGRVAWGLTIKGCRVSFGVHEIVLKLSNVCTIMNTLRAAQLYI